MINWLELKISDFCKTSSGGTPSRDKLDRYYNGTIPWAKSGELKDDILLETEEKITNQALEESSAKMIAKGSILIAMYGATVGKTAILGIDATTNQAICSIQPDEKIAESKFVWYCLRYKLPELLNKRVGGAQPNISQQIIRNTTIPLPPLSEQHRIVEILDQADALRKLRAEANAKAERILPVLFYRMFGDPITNPKGWKSLKIINANAKVRYGLSLPPELKSDGLPLIRATNIHNGSISEKDMLYINPNAVPKNKNAFLFANEVIVVRSGAYTGDVAQVTKRWEGAIIGYDLVVNPGENFTGEFLESYLLTSYIQKNYFGNLKARAGQPHLNAAQLNNTPIFVPPIELQRKFSHHVNEIRNLKIQFKNSEKKVNNLFLCLLANAFSENLTANWRKARMNELLSEMEQQQKYLNEKINSIKE